MTTALERITQLSGLSGVSAAQHLKKIAGAAGIAGALLVAFSGLPTGTAAEHLLANGGTVVQPAGQGGGGVFRDPVRTSLFVEAQEDIDAAVALQIQQEDDMIIAAVARLIVTGALG